MLKVFSIYDTQAETYNTPFFMKSIGQAVRAFTDLVNNPQTDVAKHPSDYILFEVAEWDDEGGQFQPKNACRIANAWELLDGVANKEH